MDGLPGQQSLQGVELVSGLLFVSAQDDVVFPLVFVRGRDEDAFTTPGRRPDSNVLDDPTFYPLIDGLHDITAPVPIQKVI